MSDADPADRIRDLEAETARLRHLLDSRGMPGALRHQVRNTLGLLRAILRRSAEGKTSVEDFAAHVEGRFDALLRIQTALLSSPDGRTDLSSLVLDELLAHTIANGDRATIDGPAVRLDPRRAELLGLMIHELATNALKFGAFSVPEGRIDVSWTTTAPPERLVLRWAERGARLAGDAPSSRGFGIEAIEGMLPYQLKAESRLEFLPNGIRCTVALPLASGP